MKATDFIALQGFGQTPNVPDAPRTIQPVQTQPIPPDFDHKPYRGWRGRILTALGDLCERSAERLEEWSRHLRRCPNCGQSYFYGEGCNPRYL